MSGNVERDEAALGPACLEDIQNRIYTFRGVRVMLDRDLA